MKTDLAYLRKNQIEVLGMENRITKIKNKSVGRFNRRLDGPEKQINNCKLEEIIQNVCSTEKELETMKEWKIKRRVMYQ